MLSVHINKFLIGLCRNITEHELQTGYVCMQDFLLLQGCAITIARRPGLLIFRVGLGKTNAVLARRATKLRSKYKIDRNHVQD